MMQVMIFFGHFLELSHIYVLCTCSCHRTASCGPLFYTSLQMLSLSLFNRLLSFLQCNVCHMCLCLIPTKMQKWCEALLIYFFSTLSNTLMTRRFYANFRNFMQISGLCTVMSFCAILVFTLFACLQH